MADGDLPFEYAGKLTPEQLERRYPELFLEPGENPFLEPGPARIGDAGPPGPLGYTDPGSEYHPLPTPITTAMVHQSPAPP